jgi:SecD/SecF fusion protein
VTDRRKYLILMGVILLAVVGSLLLAVPGSPGYKKPVLGLDLQGGLEVVLKAEPPKGHQLTPADLDRSIAIMQKRINGLGVSEPEIRKQGSNQIVIQLAGVHNQAAAAALIGKTAQLLFFDFEPDLVGPSRGANGTPLATPSLYDLLSQVQAQAAKGEPEAFDLFKSKTVTTKAKKKGVKPTTTTAWSFKGTAPTEAELLKPHGGTVPDGFKVLKVPAHRLVVSCPVANGCPGATAASKSGAYYYLFKYFPNNPNGPPELTGKDLDSSGIRAEIDPNTNRWATLLSFTGHGSNQFQKITKAEYERGKFAAGLAGHGGDRSLTTIQQYAGHSAIVLDNQLQSTPYIDYTDSSLQDGISGGAQISTGSQSEANNLALILQTGALPVSFKQIERTDVSATLGKNSLKQAWHAALVGLLIVALFLLVLYRFLGLVAVMGLAIYALFYYSAILLFHVTLTLPGFAGLILTIGVAADANVVVFERIKEEVRAGKSVRAAISAGYGKGFHTILDANVVTAITALVLFLVAIASVKGFALMLLIGTLISLLTAVAATRAMLQLLSGFRWFDNPRFMGAQGQQTAKWLQIDFMKYRRLWFAMSGVILIAGAVSLGVRGLNLGIDFKGGTQVTFSTHKAYTTDQIAAVAKEVNRKDAIVQGRGSSTAGKYTSWQVRTRALTGAQQTTFQQDLEQQVGAYASGTKNVSSSFGHQIAVDAIWGIFVSMFLIVIYIALRFSFKFALPVILAMLHDIIITVGVYSIAFREVSVATVAAVLTVLGYSIYDTIIIFDRVRENEPLMRKQPYATIVNVSLWETIRRSLATTLITLLPIIALEILGGPTLKDFAFALIVGVTSGAYSSIFIAAPLLTIWKEREPEFAKRKRLARAGGGDEPEPDGGTPARRRPLRPRGDPGTIALQESEQALAGEATPGLLDLTPDPVGAQARREKRRQRRRTRPHGRAR